MSNTYQKTSRRAQPDPLPGDVAVPEQVIVSMAEIAESAKEGLLALAVGTGMQVMAAMFDEDAARLCGPEGKHNPGRAGYRHGAGAGSVTLGGRRLPVTRPRVRAADGSGELHLPSYDLFSSTEILGRLALEKMLAGLSSRRYGHGLGARRAGAAGMVGLLTWRWRRTRLSAARAKPRSTGPCPRSTEWRGLLRRSAAAAARDRTSPRRSTCTCPA